METRQLEHKGFEHLDEFRPPKENEWYQGADGGLWDCRIGPDSNQHGGKRWILRKKNHTNAGECWCKSDHPYIEKAGNPKREQAIKDLQQQLTYLRDTTATVAEFFSDSLNRAQTALDKLKEAI